MSQTIHIPTVADLHKLAGAAPPEHPLLSIMRMEEIPAAQASALQQVSYGFYSIGLKHLLQGHVTYGRQRYDFQEGVMGFTSPNQLLDFSHLDTSQASGWILFFQPELLHGHALLQQIKHYGFFDYETSEALHLSHKEEQSIEQIFQNIAGEYGRPIDHYSRQVVLSNIDLLLTYANRFYNRQFITRHEVDTSLLSRFEQSLKTYFSQGSLREEGIPQVAYFANELHLSANYLSDMLKSLTGKTTKEHIHFHLMEQAKDQLMSTDLSVAEIAYGLGFEYPQYFSRLFKEKVGMTPGAYRLRAN